MDIINSNIKSRIKKSSTIRKNSDLSSHLNNDINNHLNSDITHLENSKKKSNESNNYYKVSVSPSYNRINSKSNKKFIYLKTELTEEDENNQHKKQMNKIRVEYGLNTLNMKKRNKEYKESNNNNKNNNKNKKNNNNNNINVKDKYKVIDRTYKNNKQLNNSNNSNKYYKNDMSNNSLTLIKTENYEYNESPDK